MLTQGYLVKRPFNSRQTTAVQHTILATYELTSYYTPSDGATKQATLWSRIAISTLTIAPKYMGIQHFKARRTRWFPFNVQSQVTESGSIVKIPFLEYDISYLDAERPKSP